MNTRRNAIPCHQGVALRCCCCCCCWCYDKKKANISKKQNKNFITHGTQAESAASFLFKREKSSFSAFSGKHRSCVTPFLQSLRAINKFQLQPEACKILTIITKQKRGENLISEVQKQNTLNTNKKVT